MTTVSVALTTFNGARFLEAQLQSLSGQIRKPDEIVVADDGSSDHSVAILQAFARTASFPVRILINESRLGWRANFMQVMEACHGDLIALCDQDDVWLPEKLLEIEPLFENGTYLVYHDYDTIDDGGRLLQPISSVSEKAVLLPPLNMNIWAKVLGFTMVFRREIADFNPFWLHSIDKHFSGQAAHDQWITFIASILGNIVYYQKKLVKYRLHGTNTVGLKHQRMTKFLVDAYLTSNEALDKRIQITRNRIDVLERMLGAMQDERLAVAKSVYEKHLALNVSRKRLYEDPSLFGRASKLLSLMRDGGYSSKQLPISHWDWRKDCLACVFGDRFMQPLRTEGATEQ